MQKKTDRARLGHGLPHVPAKLATEFLFAFMVASSFASAVTFSEELRMVPMSARQRKTLLPWSLQ